MDDKTGFVRRFIRDVQEAGNSALCRQLVAPGFRNHQLIAGQEEPASRDEFCDSFEHVAQAFADLKVEILHMTTDGDKVWTHKVVSGRHTGEFRGIAPTGNTIAFAVMDILRIEDGRIVEHWAVADRATLMKQLGVL